MPTAGVLLAAGAGARFAGPRHKLLSVVSGGTVAARSLRSLLDAGLDAVAVVTGAVDLGPVFDEAADEHERSGIALLPNDAWESGMASSVRCATAWAAGRGFDAVVIGLADQPFVTPAAWQAVAACAAPIAVATYGGQRDVPVRPGSPHPVGVRRVSRARGGRRGNPVRLAREVWPLLPCDGDEGARPVMRRHPEIVVPVACEGRPDDIDTVEDLRRWS